MLDEMDQVQEVNCTTDRLSIGIIPGSDVDLASRQFQIGNVVCGGKEWGCASGEIGAPATAFTRKVKSVSISMSEYPPHIVLSTSDCSPFEAFENQDIDIWSEEVAQCSRKMWRATFSFCTSMLRKRKKGRVQCEKRRRSNTSAACCQYADPWPKRNDGMEMEIFIPAAVAGMAVAIILGWGCWSLHLVSSRLRRVEAEQLVLQSELCETQDALAAMIRKTLKEQRRRKAAAYQSSSSSCSTSEK